MQPTINVDETLEQIFKKDSRYHRDAYYFVRDALDVAQKRFSKGKQQPPHVSGQELLEGIRQHALDEFGPMTMTVFEEWGLAQCDDFGAIVFNMVEHSLLGKTEEDSMEDFKGGYEFFDAFRKPFLPSGKLPKKKRKKSEPASSEQGKN